MYASVHRRTFLRREHAHRLFEEPRTSVSGHRGRTGAALDLGATLAVSFDSNLSKMRAFSDRLLTALGPGALGNASPRIVESFFILAFLKIKKKISYPFTNSKDVRKRAERLGTLVLCCDHGHHRKNKVIGDAVCCGCL